MEALTFLALALFVLVAVKLPKMAADRNRKKVRALREWAGHNGWRYEEKRSELVGGFRGTPFRRGGEAVHVLVGSHRGLRVLQYEYGFTSFAGDMVLRRAFRITVVPTPVAMPVVEAEDDRTWRAIQHLAGTHAVGFDDEEFNAAYRVAASDEDFARAVLTPDIRAWLAGLSPEARHPFRFADGHVVCWESAPMAYEPDFQAVNFLADLCEQLPSEVWERPWRG
ncbi:hypothetical protein [Nocardiopsis suaedae]|uniref:DUF3137 domain-containing protein n=1 Tax=Nocardiopsis suaedae TaxID=3018444 RepID=A0ABT4TVG3_9ACTN|nr:hypothetical protein [Nocardiopsis suaedae]MDA2808689.1 hypothetical protein [Nocardiopsis suaedae]